LGVLLFHAWSEGHPVFSSCFVLTAYLENIISDRSLLKHCCKRPDILCFPGYDIDEELPCPHARQHRTLAFHPFSTAFLHAPMTETAAPMTGAVAGILKVYFFQKRRIPDIGTGSASATDVGFCFL